LSINILTESIIPTETLSAYLETDYIVYGEYTFILHIDEYSPALNNLYRIHNIDTCLFITAYNPYSQVLSESVNLKRNAYLAAELDDEALHYFPAEGKHLGGDWLGEPSYLVLGLSLEESCLLGKKYEQNAIIWSGSDSVPQLILLR